MATPQVRRSGLTMPVVTRRFVDHAWRRGCDFINLDLEDSVPQQLKAHARGLIKEAIPIVRKGGAEAFTRINHDLVHADLEAIVWPGLSKVNYPKAESAEEIRLLDDVITRLERERGIRPGTGRDRRQHRNGNGRRRRVRHRFGESAGQGVWRRVRLRHVP